MNFVYLEAQIRQHILCFCLRIALDFRNGNHLCPLADRNRNADFVVIASVNSCSSIFTLLINRASCIVIVVIFFFNTEHNVLIIVLDRIIIGHTNQIRHFHGLPQQVWIRQQGNNKDCRHNNDDHCDGCQNRNDQRFLFWLWFIFIRFFIVIFILIRFFRQIFWLLLWLHRCNRLLRRHTVLHSTVLRCSLLYQRHTVIAENNLVVLLEGFNIPNHIGGSLIAVFRIFFHRMHDDFFQTGRNIRVNISWPNWNIFDMHHGNGNRIIGIKRFLSGQHLIKHDTNGINIALFIRHVPSCLLRTDVVYRSDCLIGCSHAFFPCKLGDSEVHDFNRSVCQQHDILRLDVPMNDSTVMGVL